MESATVAGTGPFENLENTSVALDPSDLDNLSRQDLVDRIRKLKIHVQQLRNVIRRDHNQSSDDAETPRVMKRPKKSRNFDFSRHPKRHVALKVAYLGWDYQGLAVQEDTDNTIESHLFDALLKAKLIQERATSNYHRCGRTDKGVSAFCQVISIDLRCKCNKGLGVVPAADGFAANQSTVEDLSEEIDYCKILNAMLPKEIRVLGWSPVRSDFSARFDCSERIYRYYIPRGTADIEAMRTAGQYLVGEHDFQNFCKPDTSSGEVKSSVRRINSFSIKTCTDSNSTYDILEFEIRGQAFLWHQIRCIISILILVGQSLETPGIVQDLLDLSKYPRKPQYAMAADYPLVLFDTCHGNDIQTWVCSPENHLHVIKDLQSLWASHALKAQMLMQMLDTMGSSLRTYSVNPNPAITWSPPLHPHHMTLPAEHFTGLIMGTKTKIYKPLSQRPVCGNPDQGT